MYLNRCAQWRGVAGITSGEPAEPKNEVEESSSFDDPGPFALLANIVGKYKTGRASKRFRKDMLKGWLEPGGPALDARCRIKRSAPQTRDHVFGDGHRTLHEHRLSSKQNAGRGAQWTSVVRQPASREG